MFFIQSETEKKKTEDHDMSSKKQQELKQKYKKNS